VRFLKCYLLRGLPWDPHHDPRRHPRGFECADCGKQGGDYEDFDLPGFVKPLRKVFSRVHGVTRTSAWEPGRRGQW